ncbi:MAG: hypothetical protein Ct9H90mP15_02310 [Candidatus Neomarinimicrobiota bacterium]|nr:MAG: hypothetical protein Ct9H90mP15_02310 [Candidatus Neomarinimicrobiota bacterium]
MEIDALGNLPERDQILDSLMGVIDKNVLTGCGVLERFSVVVAHLMALNIGLKRILFLFDFSLIDEKKNMVKVLYPNSDWNESDFNRVYREASHQLSLMNKPKNGTKNPANIEHGF